MIIDACKIEKNVTVLTLSGRLDTVNAPLLERKIKQVEDGITELILDFAELEYISSMGLRVLLQTHKAMKEENKRMVIRNMRKDVREVFEMTGFINLMVQEEKFVVIRKDEPECIVLSFNGEMKIENVPMVSKELSEIRETKTQKPVKVVLDFKKLTSITNVAAKHLSQAINDNEWESGKFGIRNVSSDIRPELELENLGDLIE